MLIPPRYRLTPEIIELLSSIEASKEVVNALEIPPEVETNIRRSATLKSSLFSARIEGNPLTLEELTRSSETQKKLEVMNVLKAMNYIFDNTKKVTTPEILKIHQVTMKGLGEYGKYRNNMEAIFNSYGIAIYMPPPPREVPKLMEELINFINSDEEKFIPLRASLAHFSFEKIHPFLDGSGRVGRLIMQKILHLNGYGMKGLLTFEEYIDTHRSEYYRSLEEPEKDATDYLLFMLKAIEETAKKARALIIQKQNSGNEIVDYLLPRRAEIYQIIKEHTLVNFDQIKRRFMKVNERTLRYDIKKLQDQGLIRKRGATRGVYYEIISNTSSI